MASRGMTWIRKRLDAYYLPMDLLVGNTEEEQSKGDLQKEAADDVESFCDVPALAFLVFSTLRLRIGIRVLTFIA